MSWPFPSAAELRTLSIDQLKKRRALFTAGVRYTLRRDYCDYYNVCVYIYHEELEARAREALSSRVLDIFNTMRDEFYIFLSLGYQVYYSDRKSETALTISW